MDGAILVVSATDGPMPQTREHILLARQVRNQKFYIICLSSMSRELATWREGSMGVACCEHCSP